MPRGRSCTIGAIAIGAMTTVLSLNARASVVDAVEYYHAGFNHYFITASSDEIAFLDQGAFGGAWARTGQTFKVENALSSSAGAAVCRFFSASFAPRSSHFYTGLASECTTVRANPNWQYEGQAFFVSTPTTAGTCPSGFSKVYRLYNNGASGAPNHRYTTSTTVRSQMIGQGWMPEGYGEGVAFCSPGSSTGDAYALTARVVGGVWYMSYTYGISYVDKISFTSAIRNTGTSSASMPYLLLGTGPFGYDVFGGYNPSTDKYIAFWQFSTGSYNGYYFGLTGTNSLSGCFDYDQHSSDLFDYCYTLTGYRLSASAASANAEPTIAEMAQEAQKRAFYELSR